MQRSKAVLCVRLLGKYARCHIPTAKIIFYIYRMIDADTYLHTLYVYIDIRIWTQRQSPVGDPIRVHHILYVHRADTAAIAGDLCGRWTVTVNSENIGFMRGMVRTLSLILMRKFLVSSKFEWQRLCHRTEHCVILALAICAELIG